jgi:hypothetical protein
MFSAESLSSLKKIFGMVDVQTLATESVIKKKLSLMLATGNFSSKTELAKAAGLSDSYVCRVLKHKN